MTAQEAVLLFDRPSSRLDDSRWPQSHLPISLGSLTKPFVALAHAEPFPELLCRRCWKPDGHGRLTLPEALAQSCNSYFLQLAEGCSYDQIARTSAVYGLPEPVGTTPECWIGAGPGWQIPPASVIRAYTEIAARATQPTPAKVLEGLRLSARRGTARAIQMDAYAKTGTAPCSHTPKGSGDGFALALRPSKAILVRVHDAPGSEAAQIAGQILRKFRF